MVPRLRAKRASAIFWNSVAEHRQLELHRVDDVADLLGLRLTRFQTCSADDAAPTSRTAPNVFSTSDSATSTRVGSGRVPPERRRTAPAKSGR